MDIPYTEGLMLIVTIVVMAVSIIAWVIIDRGNRMDRLQFASAGDQAQGRIQQRKRPS